MDRGYIYSKTLSYAPATNFNGAPGFNSQSHIVTFDDALIKGFYLLSAYVNIWCYDLTAAGPVPLTQESGVIMQAGLSTVNIGVFGDNLRTTEVPPGWDRDNFVFKANQIYYYYPYGLYVPGNQLRWSFTMVIDGSYAATSIEWWINYVVQVGFGLKPDQSGDEGLIDWSRVEDPRITDNFLPG